MLASSHRNSDSSYSCQCVKRHAHQKGIIHRDIKPSNVLIALYDDKPVPKVIDFGVAKATGGALTQHTIDTGFGGVVGTPQYMSPEQATFNNLDIDTRSDVYSLGTLLYELLAGSPPFAQPELEKRGLLEILRVVREEEPQRPSLKLSTAEARASISANRSSEPAQLSSMMKGEIDWIVMKALEKDRTRRYETATALAKDVQRYLNGDAVEACPPTLGYRMRKAYRRNRTAVRVVSAFTLLMLIAAIVSSLLAVKAKRAEAVAERNADAFYGAMVKADTALQQLERVSGNQQVDSALLESDGRVGLLRLVQALRTLAPANGERRYSLESGGEIVLRESQENVAASKALREFVTASILIGGQEFVPLVPPLDLNTETNTETNWHGEVSSNQRLYIGSDERHGLELVAIPSLARLGVLREDTERVLQCGFSPDAKTVYTQDQDSIVRFWNADGTLRARTPLRTERFVYPAGMDISQLRLSVRSASPNKLLVADGVAMLQSVQSEWEWEPNGDGPPLRMRPRKGNSMGEGPYDLYSTRTGQFIRRLDRPGRRMSDWKLLPDSRWMTYIEESYDDQGRRQPSQGVPQVVIISTDDGRELARLDHSGPVMFLRVIVSPTGKWLLTYGAKRIRDQAKVQLDQVLLWRSSDWKQIDDDALRESFARYKGDDINPYFVTDDVVCPSSGDGLSPGAEAVFRIGKPGSWMPYSFLGKGSDDWENAVGELNGTIIRCDRALTNAETLERLKPSPGRKFHPILAKLAPDGRFWQGLDTVTEKDLPSSPLSGTYFSGFGSVDVRVYLGEEFDGNSAYDAPELRILPDPKLLDFSPDLLDLWAHIVVGGEISPEGSFQPWDQPTWAAKQRELAAMKPPHTDFPFPGWAATAPHLWFRIRYRELPYGNNQAFRLADEYRRLTERNRPDPEPDTWRTTLVAPMAEEKKSP